MTSIQSTITKYILTGILLVTIVTGFTIDKFTRQQLNTQFNRALENKAWTLALLNEQNNGTMIFEFVDEMMPEFKAREKAEYFELWLGNGKFLERSISLSDTDLPFFKISLGETLFQDIELPDGLPGRLIAIHFVPRLDEDDPRYGINATLTDPKPFQTIILVAAKNRTELIQSILLNRVVIIISLFSMLLISYLIIHFAIKKGLAPLASLSEQVENIDDHSLDTKIQTSNMYSELGAMAVQLNHLFSRLHASFNREKRFSSNVSHELRTPIAELMALSEVGKNCLDNPEMTEQFFSDAKDIAQNMHNTVESLLTLAQSESGAVKKNLSVFSLNDSIQASIKRAGLDNSNNLKIDWDGQKATRIQVYSDWGKLNKIFTNIISNAYKYSLPESNIQIRLKVVGQFLSVSISNLGPDLMAEDLQHLTEYFWRKDEARTGGKNTGLGLTLVAMLCQALNISLSFDLKEQVFTVTLGELPVHQ